MNVEIRYDGSDITDLCSIERSTFTSRAGGQPGDCEIYFKDTRQRYRFTPGKTLELYIDSTREWDGYLVTLGYNYWFGSHTADCEPCPHVTPRMLILRGSDRNILFSRRVLYNKAQPENPIATIYPANTPDDEVIDEVITDQLDDLDGVDYTTRVDNVGSPDPYQDFRVPGPTATLGQMLTEVAEATGAVYYIDPDRYLVYTDVNTPDAPVGLSDRPGAGQIGYRELDITLDSARMINDVLIWGAGQGSDRIQFHREQDAASIAAHGRWQNTQGFRFNLYTPESLNRVAESILYGSPSSKRGHKDDRVSARCAVFEPGLRAGHKVAFESEIHDFSDVIPIRELTVSFISPTEARWDLMLSHEIDEPWTTSEFWWPDIEDGDPPPPPPVQDCTVIADGSPDLAVTREPLEHGEGWRSTTVRQNLIAVEQNDPDNYWQWYNNQPGIVVGAQSLRILSQGFWSQPEIRSHYNVVYEDYGEYQGIFRDFTGVWVPGPELWAWNSSYRSFEPPPENELYPGQGWTLSIAGLLGFSAGEHERPYFQPPIFPHNNPYVTNPAPHHVTISVLYEGHASLPNEIPFFGGERTFAVRHVGAVVWDGMVSSGDAVPVNINLAVQPGQRVAFSVQIMEPVHSLPIAFGSAEFRVFDTGPVWHPNRPGSVVGLNPYSPVPCYDIPLAGANCYEAIHDYGGVWHVPVAYVPGSSRVYLNGIHQRPGVDYEETGPERGEIEFASPQSDFDSVYICYMTAATPRPPIPELGNVLMIPTVGGISARFGSQFDLWPPAIWHGVYYPHFHNGVDFGVSVGTPVYASADGRVVWETQEAGGNMIHIYHSALGIRTTYAHLSTRSVADGSEVVQGQLIGLSGDSGVVTGAHLHWGMTYGSSPEDPLRLTTSLASGEPPLEYS